MISEKKTPSNTLLSRLEKREYCEKIFLNNYSVLYTSKQKGAGITAALTKKNLQ